MKPPTIDEWVAAEIAERTPEKAPKGIAEAAIAEKMKLGITRKQAIQVLAAQAANDAGKAEPKGKPGKK
jgi:hypothetical protein